MITQHCGYGATLILDELKFQNQMHSQGTVRLPDAMLPESQRLIGLLQSNDAKIEFIAPGQEHKSSSNTFVTVAGEVKLDMQECLTDWIVRTDDGVHQIENIGKETAIVISARSQVDVQELAGPIFRIMAKPDPAQFKDKVLITQLSMKDILSIFNSVDTTNAVDAKVTTQDRNSYEGEVKKDFRNTQHVTITRMDLVDKLINITANLIDSKYGVVTEFWEKPSILYYPEGGFFKAHHDTYHKPDGTRLNNRDYSGVIYLNDDYDGGILRFPELGIEAPKQAGTLVVFPSGTDFLHEVTPVTRGKRFQIVTWYTVFGTDRMKNDDVPKVMRKF